MPIFCLDIGDKRIGIAKSDPFNQMALPQKTYWRKNFNRDLQNLAQLFKDENATLVVCGLPVSLSGKPTEQTELTLSFIENLKQHTTVPIITYDERFTTKLATRDLILAGVKREDRKNYVDSIAACYILEDYLAKNC